MVKKFNMKIGVTGNFWSGHRDIIKYFEDKLVPVFDADLLFKFLINYDLPTMKLIKKRFGESAYKYGLVDMKYFDSNKKFEDLYELIKPKIRVLWHNWIQMNRTKPYTVFLSSILFEVGLDKECDRTVNVFKNSKERRDLLMKKTCMPLATIDNILSAELSENFKSKKADFVIHNNSADEFQREVSNFHIQISKLIRDIKLEWDIT